MAEPNSDATDGDGQRSVETNMDLTDSKGAESDQRRLPRREIEKIVDSSAYTRDRLISSGSYGDVYQGQRKNLPVAVKRLRKVEKRTAEEFDREIKINALVRHDNIVKLHAYYMYQPGTTSDYTVDLIMDFIDGCTLTDAVFENKEDWLHILEEKLTMLIIAQKISDAIAHLHSKRCTHTDIKSDNILIRKPDGEPFICDLGLAHGLTLSAVTTLTAGERRGTPLWSPPESFLSNYKASKEGDVWGLACVLLVLFTRRRLWEDKNGKDLSIQFIMSLFFNQDAGVQNDIAPPIIMNVQDDTIRHTLRECFAKKPENRPAAIDVADMFQEKLGSVDQKATSSSSGYLDMK